MIWNHWPVSLIPCQGKSPLYPDRLTHSALAAADNAVEYGNMVMYGFADGTIDSLIPLAKSWCYPPSLTDVIGCASQGYDKAQRAYMLMADASTISFKLKGFEGSPIVNPCFVTKNRGESNAELRLNGKKVEHGKDFRYGHSYGPEGTDLIVWLKRETTKPITVSLGSVGH